MRSDPATTPELPTACPSCGAAVRSQLSWCGRCFAALRPVEPAGPLAPVAAEVTETADDDLGAAVEPPSPMSSTEHCGVSPGADAATLDAVASRLLGALAAQQRTLPGAGLPGGRAARTGLVVAGGVLGCALIVGVLAVLGLFL